MEESSPEPDPAGGVQARDPDDERELIRALHARCARAADDEDRFGWVHCFTPGGSFSEPGVGTFRGHEELSRFVLLFQAKNAGARARHVLSNLEIELHGDRATSRSYVTYFHTTRAGTRRRVIGSYTDTMRRVDDTWLFESRVVTHDTHSR